MPARAVHGCARHLQVCNNLHAVVVSWDNALHKTPEILLKNLINNLHCCMHAAGGAGPRAGVLGVLVYLLRLSVCAVQGR